MPRSDDDPDFLQTYTSEGEGKSKSTRIAPLEVGRDEAPARLLALGELGSGSIRTPPSGTRLLHFDSAGELVSETGSGTTEEVRGADELVTLTGSPVPVGSGTNLELEQGQSIQDDTGSNRVTVGSSDVAISTLDVSTFSTTPRFDQGLQVEEGEAIEDDSGTSRVSINTSDVGISTADVGSFSTQPTFSSGLAVSAGQTIEDGNGTERLTIGSGATLLRDNAGSPVVRARNGANTELFALGGQPVVVADLEGSFDALAYSTSSTRPGTLSLLNVVMDFDAGVGSTTGDSMTANPESDTEDGFIEVEISGTRFQIPAYTP